MTADELRKVESCQGCRAQFGTTAALLGASECDACLAIVVEHVRRQTIEECANICDSNAYSWGEACAARLRALTAREEEG